jgi:outer membrane protein assembly factor BamB
LRSQSIQNLVKAGLAVSLLLLASCSTLTEFRADMADKMFGAEPANPPAELKQITASYQANIDWSVKLGETDKYDYTPAVNAGFVYSVNTEGEVLKLDLATGKQLWHVNLGETISGGVGADGGLVLVGSNKGSIYALDFSGKILWKANLSSEILSVPRYYDGKVIVRTGDDHIYGLDAADGSRKWVYERTSPALTLRSSAGIVVDSGAVYAGFAGGKLAALRADNGKLLWDTSVAQPKGVTEIERITDITSLPFVDGPLVYAVAYQGKVAAIDRRSGKVIWDREISSYRGLTADDGTIYISHTLGSFYALEHDTGRTVWRLGDLANRRLTAPLSTSSFIAVGDLEGYIHFLSRDDGKIIGRIKVDDKAVMSLVAGGTSQIIAETRGGGLYAISYK